mmetsp:Transcript_306/g.1032  ORF Transcript_306/g.1032 Transcript_306/m.1032 type:complete len:103 (+) Transcript_306:1750-2058(+)
MFATLCQNLEGDVGPYAVANQEDAFTALLLAFKRPSAEVLLGGCDLIVDSVEPALSASHRLPYTRLHVADPPDNVDLCLQVLTNVAGKTAVVLGQAGVTRQH